MLCVVIINWWFWVEWIFCYCGVFGRLICVIDLGMYLFVWFRKLCVCMIDLGLAVQWFDVYLWRAFDGCCFCGGEKSVINGWGKS